MGFEELMQIPLKRFWFLANQVDRLRAEQEIRQLQLLGSAQSGDAYKEAIKALKNEMGTVFVWSKNESTEIRIDPKTGLDPEFDRAGLQALKKKGRLTG